MEIDFNKIQEYTGIKATTTEEFISQFPAKFIPADQKNWDEETRGRVFGRTLGSVAIGIKQLFDEDGVSITGDDLKQPPEAVAKLGVTKLKEKWALEKAELEKTAGLSADEKIKEAQETINKLSGKNKDYERLLKEKAQEFEQLSANQKNELKKFKLNSVYKDAQNAIPWNPDKDEYSRKGFLAEMKEKYGADFEAEDSDEHFAYDKKTNQRVKAEGTNSTFMSLPEIYKHEAIKAGMAAVNKKAGSLPTKSPGLPASTPQQKPITQTPMAGRKQMANTRFVKE